MPVLFRDGRDRRNSARIPLSTAVRIGPPNGTPYALVSAGDLSKGGMFIDADRPVRVGARFSAEIELADAKVYIPEAVVAYNRDRHDGAGFGVRFVAAEEDALSAIAEEIDRVAGVSDLPTLPPLDLSHYPEPSIVEEALAEEALDVESVIQASRVDRSLASLRETRQRFIDRAKSAPSIFRILTVAGSVGLVASAAFALAQGPHGDAVAHDPSEHGVAASTHQVLMGKQDVATLDKVGPSVDVSAIEDLKLRRKMLPPLVVLDEEKIEGTVPKPVPPRRIERPAGARTIRVEGIDPGARILKTHAFKAPARFVIDLAGQTSALKLPAGVRAGRHPEFYRVVVDEAGGGKASLAAGTMTVTLTR